MLRPNMHLLAQGAPVDASATIFQRIDAAVRRTPPYVIAWWFFTTAVLAANLRQFFPELSGISYLLSIAGTGGCGWAWFLARGLFRPAPSVERWVIMVIATIIAVESPWVLSGVLSNGAPTGELHRILANAASLICISALLLVLLEAVHNYRAQDLRERRFRQIFIGGYGGLISVSMLWAINAEEGTFAGHWQDTVLTGCGLAGIVLTRLAVSYRKNNPLGGEDVRPSTQPGSAVMAGDAALARRIIERMADEEIYSTPNLRVADFSEMLGEHDYKITQCITGPLQYRNFNHLINSFRIRRAKQLLIGSQNENHPILPIAFDCGFNSIGPFNRAFKREVGMTPREFRASKGKETPPLVNAHSELGPNSPARSQPSPTHGTTS